MGFTLDECILPYYFIMGGKCIVWVIVQYVNKRQEDNVAVLARVHVLLHNQSRCFPITTLLLRPK